MGTRGETATGILETIFVSGVQKDLLEERKAVAAYVRGDPLLKRFFDVFLFEELPARDRLPDDAYLSQIDSATVYLGIFGKEYGAPDSTGLSPTEREFNRATEGGKERLIFVKGADDNDRDPRMSALVRRAGGQLIRRRFMSVPDLTSGLYASLVEYLEETSRLRTVPFDAAPCGGAELDDLSEDKLQWLVISARREPRSSLPLGATALSVLRHLNLMDHDDLTHAAVLLFGRDPQRFLPSSEVKCLHFHGKEVRKPIPSYQIYKGTVFDLVDQAVDFVMSKLARMVGTRESGPQAQVEYEIPRQAVAEAIVNAVAHRDYSSKASVQVVLFADRLEVSSPGRLPSSLTPALLRQDHPSLPHNPLVAEPLFLAHYIEKVGTGTIDMIEQCRGAGLPEPSYQQRGGVFVVTLWRSVAVPALARHLGISERQTRAVVFARTTGRITNAQYRALADVAYKTAGRDLDDLVTKGVLERNGERRGTYYTLVSDWDMNGTYETSDPNA